MSVMEGEIMQTIEDRIKWEGKRFWVNEEYGAYTVFEIKGVASESVQSFARTEDGLSLAIAYAKYRDGRVK
jgi:hypothetical protein